MVEHQYLFHLQILYPNMKITEMMSQLIEPAPVMSGMYVPVTTYATFIAILINE